MFRVIDVFLTVFILLVLWPAFLIIYAACLYDTGKPLFLQKRVGRGLQPFVLIKFRTMTLNTRDIATHLVSLEAITPLGSLLRRTKLDELPQLWNVLKGDMSLVGPRPCLLNQQELINARKTRGVYLVRPGITGLAQVSGIDMSTPELLAEIDEKMLRNIGILNYFKLLLMTVLGRGGGDRICKL